MVDYDEAIFPTPINMITGKITANRSPVFNPVPVASIPENQLTVKISGVF